MFTNPSRGLKIIGAAKFVHNGPNLKTDLSICVFVQKKIYFMINCLEFLSINLFFK